MESQESSSNEHYHSQRYRSLHFSGSSYIDMCCFPLESIPPCRRPQQPSSSFGYRISTADIFICGAWNADVSRCAVGWLERWRMKLCVHTFYVAFLFIHLLPSSTSTESYIFRVIFAMDFPRESEDYIIVIEADDDAKKMPRSKRKTMMSNDGRRIEKKKNYFHCDRESVR